MNKFGVVFGITAAVAMAGCMDPNYKVPVRGGQNQVKNVPTAVVTPAPEPAPVTVTPDVTPVTPVHEVKVIEVGCKCAPGTKHTAPCGCGAPDCKCEVVPPAHAAEETTDYIVQRGDYLAKISKKFNVTIASLRRVNPQIKNDVVKIGQKIKIPGKVDVGEQKVPAGSFKETPAKAPREYKPYAGPTKEYVVKSGDTLGAIAYGNGINIRQLKELNGLSDNTIRVGQKLKIPAEKVAAAPAPAPVAAEKKPVAEKKPAATAKAAAPAEKKPAAEAKPAAPAEEKPVAEAVEAPAEQPKAPAADESVTHIVQEGEDITGLSIRFSLSPAEIRELNSLGENDELKPGQVLKLPADTQL